VLFNRVYQYAKANLAVDGLFAWRIEGGIRARENAVVDDLRILGALLDADGQWGGYLGEAESLGAALEAHADGRLADWYSLTSDSRADVLSLSYVDIATLRRMAKSDEDWAKMGANAEDTLKSGALDGDFLLYYPRYDYATGAYEGEAIHPTEAMIALLHLAQAGELPDAVRDFLVNWVGSGPVYARYTMDVKPAEGYLYESTATYALMVLIGCELRDADLIRPALWRMERMRVMSYGDVADGAYAHIGSDDNASFDTLCALLAWQAIERGGFLPLNDES
jgi:hypothetical protein